MSKGCSRLSLYKGEEDKEAAIGTEELAPVGGNKEEEDFTEEDEEEREEVKDLLMISYAREGVSSSRGCTSSCKSLACVSTLQDTYTNFAGAK